MVPINDRIISFVFSFVAKMAVFCSLYHHIIHTRLINCESEQVKA